MTVVLLSILFAFFGCVADSTEVNSQIHLNQPEVTALSKTVGMLEPGGTLVSESGVVISAPIGALDKPIRVTIEVTNNPSGEYPLRRDIDILSPFYRIRFETDDLKNVHPPLALSFPLPDGFTREDVGLLALFPAEWDFDSQRSGLHWQSAWTSDLVTDAVASGVGLLSSGVVYVLFRSQVF